MNKPWSQLGEWWLEELATDPIYQEELKPLALSLLDPQPGLRYLEVGCGEGRLLASMRERGVAAVGSDLNQRLLVEAQRQAPVVRGSLPSLRWVRPGSFDGVLVSLVLEHLPDERPLFRELARAVTKGGILALVINHPIWTAPESSPIEEEGGETLWRPGRYFGRGFSDEPAGESTVRFYHRTMADLLNAASAAGWDLDRMEERGVSPAQVDRFPEYAGQEHIPRLLGVRWRRRG